MNYEDLRKFQRMERNASNLAEIPSSFYYELNELIKEQKEKYEKTHSIEDAKVLENLHKIALDIYGRREMKILTKALKAANSGLKENNLVEFEVNFFNDAVKLIKENKSNFDKVLVGEFSEESAEKVLSEKVGKIEGEEEAEDLNMVLVRILQNMPKFVSSEGKELGPFESNQMVRLPSKEAHLLVEKEFAELV